MGNLKVLNGEIKDLFFDVFGMTIGKLGLSKEGLEIENCPIQIGVPQPDGKQTSFTPGKDLCSLSKPAKGKKAKFSLSNDIVLFKKVTQYDQKSFATTNKAGNFSDRMTEPNTHCYEVYNVYPKGSAGKWFGMRPDQCGAGNFVERTVFCGEVKNESSSWMSYGISYYCINPSQYNLLETLLNQSVSRK